MGAARGGPRGGGQAVQEGEKSNVRHTELSVECCMKAWLCVFVVFFARKNIYLEKNKRIRRKGQPTEEIKNPRLRLRLVLLPKIKKLKAHGPDLTFLVSGPVLYSMEVLLFERRRAHRPFVCSGYYALL